ncbi:MAG: stalk domain-containing protein, partial [Mycobacterium leprae]
MGAGRNRFCLLLGFLVYLTCSLAFPTLAGADAESIMVLIMGHPIHLKTGDPAPYVMDGIIMVPARPTLEAFDAAVLWNGEEQSITAVTDAHRITLFIGRTDAIADGRTHKLEMAPVIMQGRAVLPLRFLVESFGATMEWSRAVWVDLPDDPAASALPVSVLAGGPSPRNLTGAVRQGGTVMVPMAQLVRAMGGQSDWDPAQQAEMARVGGTSVTVFRGQSLAFRNSSTTTGGHWIDLGITPRLADGTLMVPIETLVPALGGRVKRWDGERVIAPPLLLQVNGQRLLPPSIDRNGVVMADTQSVLAAMGAEDLTLPEAVMPLQELIDTVGGSLAWVGNEAVVASPITVVVRLDQEESVLALPARLGENASVMVPTETLADDLHLSYTESRADASVTLRSGSRWVTLYADRPTAARSSGPAWSKTEEFRASATPSWQGAQLKAPLSDLVESLGLRYQWDSRTATATITYAPTP